MKVFKFLGRFCGGFCLLTTIVTYFFLMGDVDVSLSGLGKQVIVYLQRIFIHLDNWNWVALTFLISASTITLCINDILILKSLSSFVVLNSLTFWKGGFVWLGKTLMNACIWLLNYFSFVT